MVNLRRIDESTFELQSDVACTIGIEATRLRISRDGRTFTPIAGQTRGKLQLIQLTGNDLVPTGKVWIRR